MQESVPQFIDREQKLLGPLTVKQTVVLGATALIIAISYFLLNFFVFSIILIVVGSIGIAVAFIKINDQPLYKVSASFLGYFVKPRSYLWQHEEGDTGITQKQTTTEQPQAPAEKQISGEDIKNLAEFLDK